MIAQFSLSHWEGQGEGKLQANHSDFHPLPPLESEEKDIALAQGTETNSRRGTRNSKPSPYPFPNSCDRFVALTTASITVPRKPFCSMA